MGKCKSAWFTPKGGKKAHRDSFKDCDAQEKQWVVTGAEGYAWNADCLRYDYGHRFPRAKYSPIRPPDEECCKKCLRIDEAEKAKKG